MSKYQFRNIGSMTTEEYWKERFNFTQKIGDRTQEEILAHLKKTYAETLQEINKEIEAFYGRYAEKNGLTLADVKKRLNPEELKSAKHEINKYYSEVDKLARTANGKVSVKLLRKYKEQLRLQSARAYMSRLEDLKTRINHNLVKMGVEEDNTLHKGLYESAKYSYDKSAYELSKYMGFANNISDTQFEKMVNEQWLGRNFSDSVWENKGKLEQQLEKTFLTGVMRGQNPKKIASEMQKNMGGEYYRCSRLVKTELNHIQNEATFKTYKDYGVKRYEFLCGEDERSCTDCVSLDGTDWALNEKEIGINYPPIHPNCQCTTVPYFEEDEIDKFFDGNPDYEVPDDMSYSDWLEMVYNQK